jgi:hypothetical protein
MLTRTPWLKISPAACLRLFFFSLVLGIQAGVLYDLHQIYGLPFAVERLAPSPVRLATPANGQRNLLVIGVDRLSNTRPNERLAKPEQLTGGLGQAQPGAPRLASLWLVSYFPGVSAVSLVPLYPAPGAADSGWQRALVASFHLNALGVPSVEFLHQLEKRQIWWSNYAILDEIALASAIDMLGGVELDGQWLSGPAALLHLPHSWEDPSASLLGQAQLLHRLCRQALLLPQETDFTPLWRLAPAHLRSDLDPPSALAEWQSVLLAQPGLSCEFPLISISKR